MGGLYDSNQMVSLHQQGTKSLRQKSYRFDKDDLEGHLHGMLTRHIIPQVWLQEGCLQMNQSPPKSLISGHAGQSS